MAVMLALNSQRRDERESVGHSASQDVPIHNLKYNTLLRRVMTVKYYMKIYTDNFCTYIYPALQNHSNLAPLSKEKLEIL